MTAKPNPSKTAARIKQFKLSRSPLKQVARLARYATSGLHDQDVAAVMDAACSIVPKIDLPEVRDVARSEIVDALVDRYEFEQALKVAGQCESAFARGQCYVEIAQAASGTDETSRRRAEQGVELVRDQLGSDDRAQLVEFARLLAQQ